MDADPARLAALEALLAAAQAWAADFIVGDSDLSATTHGRLIAAVRAVPEEAHG